MTYCRNAGRKPTSKSRHHLKPLHTYSPPVTKLLPSHRPSSSPQPTTHTPHPPNLHSHPRTPKNPQKDAKAFNPGTSASSSRLHCTALLQTYRIHGTVFTILPTMCLQCSAPHSSRTLAARRRECWDFIPTQLNSRPVLG